MKLNIIYLKLVIQHGINSARLTVDYEIWKNRMLDLLKDSEQILDDTDYYLKAVWTIANELPKDIIYNKDLMNSAVEHIGLKSSTGENLKTTRVTFAKIYGDDSITYLNAVNAGLYVFPRSYFTAKKRTRKRKSTRTTSEKKQPVFKWEEEILIGTINTSAFPNAEIKLCKKNDDKFISIGNKVQGILLPLDAAQSVTISIESAITQAKRLGWI